jgi:predicted lipid-binding transport protein (Tim44 family)
MSMSRRLSALALAAALAFGPVLAEARPGYTQSAPYGSIGSRGSRTWQSVPDAAPVQRSVTPAAPAKPAPAWTNPGWRQPAVASGGGFWRGLAGGFAGAWLWSLFAGGGWGAGGYGLHAGGFLGSLMMLALILWVGRLVWRGIACDGPALRMAASPAAGFVPPGPSSQPAAGPTPTPLAVEDRDFAEFGRVLTGIQAAWSRQDLAGLQRLATPEMASYFAGMLADNTSRGIANRVESVTLLRGLPVESWREGSVDYATCRLRWSAVDYTHRLDRAPGEPGYLVDGDPSNPQPVEEFWTFRRTGGGAWLLSAIQQAA